MLHVCIHQSACLRTSHKPWFIPSTSSLVFLEGNPGTHSSRIPALFWNVGYFFICSEFHIENMPCCISNIIAVLTEHDEHSTNARYSHQIAVEVDGGTGSKTVLGRLGLGVIAVFSFHAQLL